MTEGPRCARKGCEEKPRFVFMFDDGILVLHLAYSCQTTTHLSDAAYATRHLGADRTLKLIEEEKCEQ